jgi:YVTN family beta-propeller protein
MMNHTIRSVDLLRRLGIVGVFAFIAVLGGWAPTQANARDDRLPSTNSPQAITPPHIETGKDATALQQCQTAQVRLFVKGAGDPYVQHLPLDVMLTIDRSSTMYQFGANPINSAKAAAKLLVDQLDPTRDRVGLVSFAPVPTLNVGLTSDLASVKIAIDGLTMDVGTNLGGGVKTAQAEIATHGRPNAVKVMVVLTDGVAHQSSTGGSCEPFPTTPTACTQDAIDQAAIAKAAGTIIFTIGLNLDGMNQEQPGAGTLARQVLKTMASGPGFYYESPTPNQLNGIFSAIGTQITTIAGSNVVVTDILPSSVHYIDGSAVPAPTSVNGQTLTWNLGILSINDTRTIMFNVYLNPATPNQLVDVYPDSRVTYTNYLGKPASVPFPETHISSVTLCPTATPTQTKTPLPPTRTPTSTPTNTPLPPTATPTNTPVPPTATPTHTSVPRGCIVGTKTDNNGVLLSGWQIFLGWVENGQARNQIAYTDSNGAYRFDNLTPGLSYQVSENTQGWTPLLPSSQNIPVLQSGPACATVPFQNQPPSTATPTPTNTPAVPTNTPTNTPVPLTATPTNTPIPPGCILGTKTDHNGTPLSGWQIFLGWVENGQARYRTIYTDRSGVYRFDSLTPGLSYQVSENTQGWTPLLPSSQNVPMLQPGPACAFVPFQNQPPSTVTPTPTNTPVPPTATPTRTQTPAQAPTIVSPTPTNTPTSLGCLSGTIRDLNGSFLPGWTLNLTWTDPVLGPQQMTTVTDAHGSFQFTNLKVGLTYTITEVLQRGWINVLPTSWTITVSPGLPCTNVIFVNRRPAPAPTLTKTPAPAPPISIPVQEPKGLASDTTRNRLYVTSRNTNSVLVWDEIAQRTLTTIPVGQKPWGVGVVNNRVFVGNSNSASVSVIDATRMAKMTDIRLNGVCDGGPTNLAVNPNNNRVYVALYGMGRVAVIDATSNTLVDCVPTAGGTTGVAVNPLLNQMYVSNRDAKNLQVFDISAVPARLIWTEPLGGVPYFVQANLSTSEVYVTVAYDAGDYLNANNLQAYSASDVGLSLSVATIIGNTYDGGFLWVSQASGALYIAATADNKLQIMDLTSFSIVQTIPMPDPFGITENRGLSRMYIGNRGINSIDIERDDLGGAPPP